MMKWTELYALAHNILRTPSHFDQEQFFNLVVDEKRCNPHSWTLYDVNSAMPDMFLCKCSIWMSFDDYPDVDTLEDEGYEPDTPSFNSELEKRMPTWPTIKEYLFKIPVSNIQQKLNAIRSEKVFPIVQECGFNGEILFYEMSIGHALSGVSYQWADNGPDAWRCITGLAHDIETTIIEFSPIEVKRHIRPV